LQQFNNYFIGRFRTEHLKVGIEIILQGQDKVRVDSLRDEDFELNCIELIYKNKFN
jgi:hypothetical protein